MPFPGNWFGAIEDLVPIHTDALPDASESPRAVVQAAPPLDDQPASSAADASDFWEGDAATLEEVPAATDSPSSISLLRSPAAGSRKTSSRSPRDTYTAAAGESAHVTGAGHGWGLRLGLLVAALLAVGIAAVLLTVVVPGALRSGKSDRQGTLAAASHRQTQTVTQTVISSTTVTTKAKADTSPRSHRRTRGTQRKLKAGASKGENKAGAGGTGSADSSAPSTDSSSDNGTSSAVTTAPAPTKDSSTSGASGSGSTSGSGCAVQSPDSGCLP